MVELIKENALSDVKYFITGRMVIKNVARYISFPVKLHFGVSRFETDADFIIDRTWWGISYGNKKSLGNKFISNKVKSRENL